MCFQIYGFRKVKKGVDYIKTTLRQEKSSLRFVSEDDFFEDGFIDGQVGSYKLLNFICMTSIDVHNEILVARQFFGPRCPLSDSGYTIKKRPVPSGTAWLLTLQYYHCKDH